MRIVKKKNLVKELYQLDRVTIVHNEKTIVMDVRRINGKIESWDGVTERDRNKLRRIDTQDETWDRYVLEYLQKRLK